ncbi:MAG: hypothetical protein IPP88_15590 [Betaproteobacteria bacterium]|nr:hypothetical protein [Betaproteobacteria bacterium]
MNAKAIGAPIIELVPPMPAPDVFIDVPSIASTANSETMFLTWLQPGQGRGKGACSGGCGIDALCIVLPVVHGADRRIIRRIGATDRQ